MGARSIRLLVECLSAGRELAPAPRLEGGARRPKVPVSALPSDPRIRGPRLCRGRALRETVEVAEEEARDA